MGFLQDFGLDELISSVGELTNELDGIRKDIISSVVNPSEDLKSIVDDISGSIKGSSSND